MPRHIDQWLEGYVTALSEEKYSYEQIRKRCAEKDYPISKKGIFNILNQRGKTRAARAHGLPKPPKPHPKTVRTPALIQKVKAMASTENPPTQRTIARKLRTTPATINKVINKDLQLKLTHKPRVHKLLPKHVTERKGACRRLYERYLAGEKWKFVATVDEAWIYLTDCSKKRAVYYRPRSGKDFTKWFSECKETFPKGFMVVAGFTYRGKFQLRKVDSKVKINSTYYQTNVLDPIFRQEIPAMYGNETCRVTFHQDKASSHTSRSTRLHLAQLQNETGITAIPFEDIPTKSPDAAPMDFCAFGLLKRALGSRRPKTIAGLWKVAQDEWSKLDMKSLQASLLSWKHRCRAIVKKQGHQIEHDRRYKYGLYT